MSRFAILFAAIALVAGQAQAGVITSTNLLSNGGFEFLLGPENQILTNNWSTFVGNGGVPAIRSGVDPFNGDFHLQVSNDAPDGAFVGIQQTELGVITGEEYTFSGYALSTELDASAEFRIEWLDEFDQFVGGQFDTNTAIDLVGDYSLFTQTVVAPVGATQLRAVIAVLPQGNIIIRGESNVLFDDISLTTSSVVPDPDPIPNPDVVPEPTTLAIFSLIGMAGVSPRRRKKNLRS